MADPTPAKIIIVEDEVLIADDLAARLTALGYQVCGAAAASGQALEMVERYRPDLVMMDILLQGETDGIDTAAAIRDQWGIPVVFLTAYADAERLERAKLTYPFGYILKPFQERDLKITTEMALYVAKVDGERRKAEEALRDSEERFRSLFEQAGEGILLTDTWGHIANVNRKALEILGYSRRDFLGLSAADLIHPDDLKTTPVETIRRRAMEGSLVSLERRFRTATGRYIPVEVTVSFVPNAGLHQVFFHDITDRKRAEEALRETEARLRTLSDNLPNGLVYQIDSGLDGQQRTFSYISAGVEQLHGITASAALNDAMAIYGQVLEEDRLLVAEREAKALAEMSPFSVEARIRQPSGETRWRLFNSAPRRLANNHLVWDGIEIDITHRKQSEEALRSSESCYRKAQAIGHVGSWEYNIQTTRF